LSIRNYYGLAVGEFLNRKIYYIHLVMIFSNKIMFGRVSAARSGLFACVFLFISCSTIERDNPYDQRSPNYNGWVYGEVRGTPVTYDGETYETVVIGSQTWMARNLNYNASGSKCYNDSPSNCATYGRLYDWATAMDLPNCGYGTSCSSQIGAKHRGICPDGWHIPSNAEWTTLENFVGSSAGKKLKATSGWNSGGNGTDEFGFAALPGGGGDSDGDFSYVGYYGDWWSASENGASRAYSRGMDYDYEGVHYLNYSKDDLFSVRCLQD
jgi:uncharacterized protein (TIGR02145 family)